MNRFGDIRSPARRESWGTAVEVDEGLFRIRLNNPVGLLLVNTYVYKSRTDLLVFDPGWPWTLEALEQALRDLGLGRSFADVTAWLYTHTHIDHMGAAALLADFSTAPHYTCATVEPYLNEWHSFQDRMNDWTPWAATAFDDPEPVRSWREHNEKRREARTEFLIESHGERAVQQPVLLEFGERFRIADLELDFIDARGHDPYHGAFFDRSRGWLFSGDVVIATVTPISRAMEDDLDAYLDSLARLGALDASLLLPGHGVQRSGDLGSMFARSLAYQHEVRDLIAAVLDEAPEPLGLLEIGLRTVPDRQPLSPRGRWAVHLALIDSHLDRLARTGDARVHPGPRYSR